MFPLRRNYFLLPALSLASLFWSACSGAEPQADQFTIAGVYFYGCDGSHVDEIKKSLPPLIGEKHKLSDMRQLQSSISQAVWKAIWCFPTQVSIVNCGSSTWNIYIGLKGRSVQDCKYNPAPTAPIKMPDQVIALEDQLTTQSTAVLKAGGNTSQDTSKGYALDADPTSRAIELRLREWVLAHQDLASDVLKHASDAKDRALAATVIAYLDTSKEQIAELVDATKDCNQGVRNNATRALGCIAASNKEFAAQIPAERFVEMLNSYGWTDRNKGEFVLSRLCLHDPTLIYKIQDKVFQALSEMAYWDKPHAISARMLLAEIGRLSPEEQKKMLEANDIDGIIAAAKAQIEPASADSLPASEADLQLILKESFTADQSDPDHLKAPECLEKLLAQHDKFAGTSVEAPYSHALALEAFHIGQRAALTHDNARALTYFDKSLEYTEQCSSQWQARENTGMARSEIDWANYLKANIAYLKNDLKTLESLKDKCDINKRFVEGFIAGLKKYGSPDYKRDY